MTASGWIAPSREAPDGRRSAPAAQSQAADNPPVSEREALYRYVKEQLAGAELHSEDIQYELGRWIHLLETTEADLNGRAPKAEVLRRLEREAGAAIPALLSAKPDPVFARTLRVQAEIGLLRHNGPLKRNLIHFTDGSPLLTVCLGAFCALFLGLGTHFAWYGLQGLGPVKALMPFDPIQSSAVASAAFLGGLVSILSRLKSFSRLGDFDHVFLFANALFKPFVGVIFGLFAYAFWLSGLLPLDQKLVGEVTVHQLWMVGFLAGFSERFAQDLISRGESILPRPTKP